MLQESPTGAFSFNEMCAILSDLMDANVYVANVRGKVIGVINKIKSDSSTIKDQETGIEAFPGEYNEGLMNVKETTANMQGEKALSISENLDTRTEFFAMGGHVYMIRNLIGRGFKRYAVLIMEINPTEVFESLKSVWEYRGMDISFKEDKLYSEGDYASSQDVITCTRKSVDGEFTFSVAYDGTAVGLEKRSINITFMILIVFLIPLIGLLFYFFNKRINRPITTLTAASKKIAEGEYGEVVEQPKGQSGESENDMFFHILSYLTIAIQVW